jgi:DNA-directed RNA polymerase specialized sigma24 family protein
VAVSSPAFEQLLAALDPDRERAGLEYRELHHRLVKFFEWQCSRRPDEQADQVMDRMVRKIAQGERVENLRAYAYGVAKLLLREAWKEATREDTAHDQLLRMVRSAEADVVVHPAEDAEPGREQDCLDKCLASLTDKNREIILSYYSDDDGGRIGRRRQLAASLGTDLNALRVRAHRIRTQLEGCVWQCVGPQGV